MDDVSRLLRIARLEATLDKRCLLAGSTVMDTDPYGDHEVPFHVLLEGECQIEIGGVLFPMRAGDVVVIPSGARHRIITGGAGGTSSTVDTQRTTFALVTSDGDASGDHAVIDLFCGHYSVSPGAGAILFGSLPTPTQASLFRSDEGTAVLTQLSALMRAEADRDGPGSAAIMSALCTVLFALVLRTSPSAGAHSRLWTAVSDPRMSRVIQQVIDSPGEDWSIDRLSRTTLLSRATFFRRFLAATGMTFGQFLTKVRLMHAAERLESSDSSVAEIAARVGYQSESAFTRAFRTAVGQTPARFRKSQESTAAAQHASTR